jgi:ABC-2 type transport system ATP-binding protein
MATLADLPCVPAIEVRGLTKRYGTIEAVAGVDFDVWQGELFGFLGPNGAGKTTTISMLTGLARPLAGSVRILGEDCTADVKRAQHLMGIVPDESNLWPELDGFDNLCFCGALYGMPGRERRARAGELLDTFGLGDAARRKFAGYSKGMKRTLTIAAGIMHRPRILFLDEPTTGIDVASARQIRQLLLALNREGTTIFLTTHYIEEAERLCGRIAFIVAGHLVRVDTLEHLIRDVQARRVVQLVLSRPAPDPGAGVAADLMGPLRAAFPGVEFELVTGTTVRAHTRVTLALAPIVRFLEERGIDVTEARAVRPSLEDVFVRVTGVAPDQMRKERERDPKGGAA